MRGLWFVLLAGIAVAARAGTPGQAPPGTGQERPRDLVLSKKKPVAELDASTMFYARPVAADGQGATIAPPNTGLRVRLVQKTAVGGPRIVDTATTFKTGDQILFEIESNADGYLFVGAHGSSGLWTALFPDPEINGGRNRIKTFEPYKVPSGNGPDDWFEFDPPAGTEQVFVFFSKDPVPQLPSVARPESTVEDVEPAIVDGLKGSIQPRDLVLKKKSEGTKPLPATFVVNRLESGKTVMVTFSLIHK